MLYLEQTIGIFHQVYVIVVINLVLTKGKKIKGYIFSVCDSCYPSIRAEAIYNSFRILSRVIAGLISATGAMLLIYILHDYLPKVDIGNYRIIYVGTIFSSALFLGFSLLTAAFTPLVEKFNPWTRLKNYEPSKIKILALDIAGLQFIEKEHEHILNIDHSKVIIVNSWLEAKNAVKYIRRLGLQEIVSEVAKEVASIRVDPSNIKYRIFYADSHLIFLGLSIFLITILALIYYLLKPGGKLGIIF